MGTYKKEADEIRKSTLWEPMKILVWGPGNPGKNASLSKQKAYKKRLKIKSVLRRKFHRAEVHFSEDKEMIKISTGIKGQLRKEALQAKISDLVIMLDLSRGVDLELDHFIPTYPWFRDKAFIFLPNKYMDLRGLTKEVIDNLNQNQIIGFSNQEFKDCKVATQKAVDVAQTIAMDLCFRK